MRGRRMDSDPPDHAGKLRNGWDRYWRDVASVRGPNGPYLLRPGQIVADARDAQAVGERLDDWQPAHQDRLPRSDSTVVFQLRDHPGRARQDAVKRVVEAVADLRSRDLRVAPNHVLPGQQLAGNPSAIVYA